MLIRKAESADFTAVKEITLETIKSVYPHYYPNGAVGYFISYHNDKNILNDINRGSVSLLIDENVIIGTVTIKNNEISRLFVLPNYQKKGYGRALLDFAEQKIFEDYNEITISASLPAKKIYLKRGYIETEYNTIITENGDYLCYDEMKKINK